MARIKYEESVVENFEDRKNKAKLEIETTITNIHGYFTKILTDSSTDLSSIQETVDKWNTMLNTMKTKSDDLILGMENKYNEMIERAQKFDRWADGAAGKISTEPCKTEDDGTHTQQVKYFVTETGTDGEGYPTISYKKEVRTYSAVHGDESDPEKITSYTLNDTPTVASQTYSIKTEDDYNNYVTNCPAF